MFAAMRLDSAPEPAATKAGRAAVTVAPADIRVRVFNAAGVTGLGGRAADDLAARGFEVAGPAQNWRASGLARTVVRYDARYTESVKTLAASLPGARLEKVTGLGRTQEIVVGSSYDGVRAVRVKAQQAAGSASGGGARPPTTRAGELIPEVAATEDRLAPGQPVRSPDLSLAEPAMVLLCLRQDRRDHARVAAGVHGDEHEVGGGYPDRCHAGFVPRLGQHPDTDLHRRRTGPVHLPLGVHEVADRIGSRNAISSIDAVTAAPPECRWETTPATSSTSFITTPPWTVPSKFVSSTVMIRLSVLRAALVGLPSGGAGTESGVMTGKGTFGR